MPLDQFAFDHSDLTTPMPWPHPLHPVPMVRKVSVGGVAYSVARLDGVRHLTVAASPRRGATAEEQLADALRAIDAVCVAEEADGCIVQQTVFVSDPRDLDACRRAVRRHCHPDLPATTCVPQPLADGSLVSVEATGYAHGAGTVRIERLGEHLVSVRHGGIAWTHCGGIVPETTAPLVYDRSIDAFASLRRHLHGAGVAFGQLIRTWLYLGDIVGPEGETQRYKELNRARSDVFRDVEFLAGRPDAGPPVMGYPASTGIGAGGREVTMNGFALATDRPEVRAVPLENPRQTAAFDYAAVYSPMSPKFSRAMAVTWGNGAVVFVSGTASITRSETRHIGDVAAQTRETLDNIEALISGANLRRHGLPGLSATLDALESIRVYIKRPEDYPTVRAICEDRLGPLPATYTIADVCRPDLLVEIEGAAYAQGDGTLGATAPA